MKFRKIFAVVMLCFVCAGFTSTSVFAQDSNGVEKISVISPRWTYIADAEVDLAIRNSNAIVDCWVNGHYNTATKSKVIAELQVKSSSTNWIPVAIWTDTQNGYMASVYETKEINPNNTYRVKATFTVWEGSQSETITIIGDEL